ncbi:MAG: RHS repeat-associated core domain-containing protein, partial [Muribaculaceae bacterium]|nr:RHS repeat-associated core domain-containing protein [Muribaculaceae bacterium]
MLFGESDVSGDRSEANRYRYGGKEYLAAAGLNLYDFTARYLDPAVGAFLSSDPMQGDYMPLSPTLYCGADPVNRVDPTGCDLTFTGDAAQEAFEFLRQQVLDLRLSMDESGVISHHLNDECSILGIFSSVIRQIIEDRRIN